MIDSRLEEGRTHGEQGGEKTGGERLETAKDFKDFSDLGEIF